MDNEKLVVMNGVSRKKFLKFAGLSAATVAYFGTGCDSITDIASSTNSSADNFFSSEHDDAMVNLGGGDVGILNYAYALEQLEAAFYIAALDAPYEGMRNNEKLILQFLCDHERAHRDWLQAAISSVAPNAIIPELTLDFSSVDFSSRNSVLQTAKALEDTGVSAYNGAGRLIENPDFLLQAGKIVSVEARHAAAIRSIFDSSNTSFAGDDIIDENGLEMIRTTGQVLEIAQGFIVEVLNGSNLPQPQ